LWLDYLGPAATVHGVDIEPDGKSYENDKVKVSIGDQSDRGFWKEVLNANAGFDIVIDDGSHMHRDQIVSLEEIFPKLNPGGVYICEDVHGNSNRFASYVMGIASLLNGQSNPIQQCVESVFLHRSRAWRSRCRAACAEAEAGRQAEGMHLESIVRAADVGPTLADKHEWVGRRSGALGHCNPRAPVLHIGVQVKHTKGDRADHGLETAPQPVAIFAALLAIRFARG
jgi:hypothetical protein